MITNATMVSRAPTIDNRDVENYRLLRKCRYSGRVLDLAIVGLHKSSPEFFEVIQSLFQHLGIRYGSISNHDASLFSL